MNTLLRRGSRGQTLVEFALILPIFILLLLGILDLGRAVFNSSTMNNAAREAARVGITDQMCLDILNQARTRAVETGSTTVTIQTLNPATLAVRASCPANPAATDSVAGDIGD